MRRIVSALTTPALLCLAGPNELLAQQKSEQIVVTVTPATDVSGFATADDRTRRIVVGAVIGGLVGGAVTAGCLLVHGMGAVAALPYCLVPAIIGVAFGAWVGGNMPDGRSHDASQLELWKGIEAQAIRRRRLPAGVATKGDRPDLTRVGDKDTALERIR